MRKYILSLFFCFFALNNFASIHSFYGFYGQPESVVKEEMNEFGKVYGSAMNSGVGNLMNMDFLKISLGATFMPYDKAGALKNSSKDYLGATYTTLGLSLFNINAYARLISLLEDGKMIMGGGLGYQIKIDPLLTVTPFFTYNRGLNFTDIFTMTSYALHVQAKGNFEAINPYLSLGASYNTYDTNIVLDTGYYYTHSDFLIHLSAGVKILYIYYEISFLPKAAHSFGITIDF